MHTTWIRRSRDTQWPVLSGRLREIGTYLFLLHVEVVDDDTDEEVEGEERAEDDEEDEEQVHAHALLELRLLLDLKQGRMYDVIKMRKTP